MLYTKFQEESLAWRPFANFLLTCRPICKFSIVKGLFRGFNIAGLVSSITKKDTAPYLCEYIYMHLTRTNKFIFLIPLFVMYNLFSHNLKNIIHNHQRNRTHLPKLYSQYSVFPRAVTLKGGFINHGLFVCCLLALHEMGD